MLPFDPSLLPQLPTRKALVAVDFQVDFLPPSSDPVTADPYTPKLPISHTANAGRLINSVIDLADRFRASGNVVCWVESTYQGARSAQEGLPQPQNSSAGEGKDGPTDGPVRPRSRHQPEPHPDAFLSPGPDQRPPCVQPSTPGASLHPLIEEAIASNPRDLRITKSHYSAFRSPTFLNTLRVSFVTELFVCGSILNAGVYATAIEAAGHGYAITLIDSCCGWTDDGRKDAAIKDLVEITGCQVLGYDDAVRELSKAGDHENSTGGPDDLGGTMAKSGLFSSTQAVADDAGDEGSTNTIERDAPPAPASPSDCCRDPGESSTHTRATTATDYAAQPDESIHLVASKEPVSTTEGDDAILRKLGDLTIGDGKDMNEEVGCTPGGGPSSSAAEPSIQAPASLSTESLLPYDTPICEGDTMILSSLLPSPLADTAYDTLLAEVMWNRMSHQGGEVPRRVAVQGTVQEDGSIPIYRHPADASPPLLPFTPTVLIIREEVEKRLGHEVNHVLIQHYRTGYDFISEHSDKTLDIVHGSYICNISLGAERTMVFRTKRDSGRHHTKGEPEVAEHSATTLPKAPTPAPGSRAVVRVKLPHNSLCKMGLRTNMKWLHAIRPDKRMDSLKSSDELAYNGGRISLTFRHIGTFLSADESVIWGQGATSKTREGAQPVINGQGPETVRMLHAFGTENHASDFDWDKHYGSGFDVLHMRTAVRLLTGADPVANMRVALMLAECGIGHAKGSGTGTIEPVFGAQPSTTQLLQSRPIKFCDSDEDRTTVEGDIAILWYLDTHHFKPSRGRSACVHAKQLTALEHATTLTSQWRAIEPDGTLGRRDVKSVRPQLTLLDSILSGSEFVVEGQDPSIADFALWPVLHLIASEVGADDIFAKFEKLRRFYDGYKRRDRIAQVLDRAEGRKKGGIETAT